MSPSRSFPWAAPNPWTLKSINSLGSSAAAREPGHVNLYLATAWLLSTVGFGLRYGRRRGRSWVVIALSTALATAVASHLLWLYSLQQQGRVTIAQYGRMSPIERERNVFDAELLASMRSIRGQLPLPPQARVFVVADDAFHRHRASWHLRPHNVSTFWPGDQAATALRPGDYVLIYRRRDAMARRPGGYFSVAAVELRGDELHRDAQTVLYRIR